MKGGAIARNKSAAGYRLANPPPLSCARCANAGPWPFAGDPNASRYPLYCRVIGCGVGNYTVCDGFKAKPEQTKPLIESQEPEHARHQP